MAALRRTGCGWHRTTRCGQADAGQPTNAECGDLAVSRSLRSGLGAPGDC